MNLAQGATMTRLRSWWKLITETGLLLPFVHDPRTKKPSITLLFAYLTFAMAFVSLILLHIWPTMFIATVTTILTWVIAVIFYRLRNLDKAKIDLDDRSIELEGSGDNDE